MTRSLSAIKSRFTNNLGAEPNGLYWGIKLGDDRQGAWKLDLWFLDAAGYEKHSKYCDDLRLRLTPETRSAILEIKEAYWQRQEYRNMITSDLIYLAVLDHDVRTIQDLETFLKPRTDRIDDASLFVNSSPPPEIVPAFRPAFRTSRHERFYL